MFDPFLHCPFSQKACRVKVQSVASRTMLTPVCRSAIAEESAVSLSMKPDPRLCSLMERKTSLADESAEGMETDIGAEHRHT
jgi:hypothetical protein